MELFIPNRSSFILSSRLMVILIIVGISSFGCKTTPPAPPQTQISAPTPTPSPTYSPILPENLSLPPTSSPTPPPISTPLLPQTFSPQPIEIPTLPNLPEAETLPPNLAKNQTVSPTLPKPENISQNPTKPGTENQPNQEIKSLPDGDYFYGESPEYDQPGSKYLVFRKSGNLIIGQEYFLQTDSSHCFRGTAEVNSINNVKIAYSEPSNEEFKWSFGELDSIKISQLYQLSWEKVPEFAATNLQECLKILGEAAVQG